MIVFGIRQFNGSTYLRDSAAFGIWGKFFNSLPRQEKTNGCNKKERPACFTKNVLPAQFRQRKNFCIKHRKKTGHKCAQPKGKCI